MTDSDPDVEPPTMPERAAEVEAHARGVVGRRPARAAVGHGSFVTLDFGDRLPASPEYPKPRYEWHLWVYFAAWRVEREGAVLGGSADDRPRMEEAVGALQGRAVTAVEVSAPMLDTLLTFEGGVRLRLFPHGAEEDTDHWLLFTPDGNVLTVGPGTGWFYGSGQEPW